MPVRFVYSHRYEADIGAHVFPTSKYRLVREKLIANGDALPSQFLEPPDITRAELILAHTSDYIDDLESAAHTERTAMSELPVNPEVIGAFRLAAGGSILAAECAWEDGAAAHLGGGLHHAFAGHAEGFCYVNDIAIAARAMQMEENGPARVLIIDTDVHQGNGTARIFENDDSVFTFSIHQENNYPLKQRSDLDIGLPDGIEDTAYLDALRGGLDTIDARFEPDLMIYVAGADPYREDQLGGLRLTLEGLRKRDALVLHRYGDRRIPVVVVFAGGYARRLDDTVHIHYQTCLEAIAVSRKRETEA